MDAINLFLADVSWKTSLLSGLTKANADRIFSEGDHGEWFVNQQLV